MREDPHESTSPSGKARKIGAGEGRPDRPSLLIELIPCTCGGKGQDPWSHSDSCPRGRALRKRIRR